MASQEAPKNQSMTAAASATEPVNVADDFGLLTDEHEMMRFQGFDMSGSPVTGVLTDRRLVLRTSEGICPFPFNLGCVCLKAEMDSNYAVVDLKSVEPYIARGFLAKVFEFCFKMSSQPGCCCCPKMLPSGVRLGFSRPGDILPAWMYANFMPSFMQAHNGEYHAVQVQLYKEDALKLRKLLSTHPNATGLRYISK